jgi:hypothetical protein
MRVVWWIGFTFGFLAKPMFFFSAVVAAFWVTGKI